jgi:hypothetical protein
LQPGRVIFRAQDHGHAVVKLADQRVRLGGQNGGAEDFAPVRAVPLLMQNV